ncbi:hypothetical protein [Burkholderia sp. Ac-20365]|uniref:hypothetical protein n=1 Tax=Burkholderia sp. Ac-20365 TaxID=2703897 RepID=UPI00197C8D8B|nr:hypothetical protein [Burkholderia sp. Ac-20365]MBN3761265.1 hypothetical protein [Burkholderia sp. Ac-20365]
MMKDLEQGRFTPTGVDREACIDDLARLLFDVRAGRSVKVIVPSVDRQIALFVTED